jgi:hypothetical protein
MSKKTTKQGAFASFARLSAQKGAQLGAALAFTAIALSSCNSGGAAGEDPSAGVSSVSNPSGDANSAGGNGLVTPSCVSSDPNHICLAVQFVSYKDSNGTPVANESQVNTIFNTMNKLWSQCNIGFQVEKYEQVDPTQSGLSFGAQSQSETDQIRNTYGTEKNMLLAVNTGPWGTAVNAWTNMPGSPPYGAVMEQSIVSYGDGIIYAHEFGHYLGLDHVSDQSNLMDAVIYTSSSTLTSDQCATARQAATQAWSAMIRH